jgi:uncharacterized membrane protein
MVKTGDWIKGGWALVQPDMWMHVVIALLISVISGTGLGAFIVPTLTCGWIYIFLQKMRNPSYQVQIGEVFSKGFEVFVPSLVGGILINIGANVGLGLCILPGFVVLGLTIFALPLIMDKRMDFWPAIQSSLDTTKGQWLNWSVFALVLGLVNLVGFIACIVGLLVTVPVTIAAATIAYSETLGATTPAATSAPPVVPPTIAPPSA